MNSNFNDFQKEFDAMEPSIREKALETASKLMKEGTMPEGEAIKQAIATAQEWFYDLEEEV